MIADEYAAGTNAGSESSCTVNGGIVELALLLPLDYFSVLEHLAEARGTAIARLLRQLISEFLVRELSGSVRRTMKMRPGKGEIEVRPAPGT